MKRLFRISLSLIIACFMLTGCESKKPNTDPSESNLMDTDITDNYSYDHEKEVSTDKPTEAIEIIEKEIIPLSELHVIDSSYTYSYSNGDFTDSYGNKHHTYHTFRGSGDENYAIFYLNGKYSIFSGGFVLSDSDGSNSHYYARVYADGKILFESEELTRTTGQVDFSLNISGCQQLRIEVDGSYHGTGLKLIDTTINK